MSAQFSDSIGAFLRKLIPVSCVLCGARAGESGLCEGCLASLPRAPQNRCPVCAAATPTPDLCGRCLIKPPRFDRVVAGLEYAHPVDGLVVSLKYGRRLPAARPLAYCMAQALDREPYPDIVVAMPMSRAHLAERGFNQAAEIARLACAEFGIAPTLTIARRVKAGIAQASLPWKERRKNVRGAFSCDTDLTGRSVAVVDDVLTTGATLDELAGVLKKCGARTVIGWVSARTPLDR